MSLDISIVQFDGCLSICDYFVLFVHQLITSQLIQVELAISTVLNPC
jgi:hypothetical protein